MFENVFNTMETGDPCFLDTQLVVQSGDDLSLAKAFTDAQYHIAAHCRRTWACASYLLGPLVCRGVVPIVRAVRL